MNVKTQNVSVENANAKKEPSENAVSLRTVKKVFVPTWRNVIVVVLETRHVQVNSNETMKCNKIDMFIFQRHFLT